MIQLQRSKVKRRFQDIEIHFVQKRFVVRILSGENKETIQKFMQYKVATILLLQLFEETTLTKTYIWRLGTIKQKLYTYGIFSIAILLFFANFIQ